MDDADDVDGPTDPTFGFVTPETLVGFTDLYELTMLSGYHEAGHTPAATFTLYFRELPPDRGYLLATGIEQVLAYLQDLSVPPALIEYFREQGFPEDTLASLADLAFTGDVWAVPEGTPVFPDEPILEVTAPLPEAQLVETLLINQVGLGSLAATKAARVTEVVERHGDGQAVVDFGSRRAQGVDAGLKVARAGYVGGFAGTSNVLAGHRFGVPTVGTMAHSWVQSFPDERTAFAAFVESYGPDATLLVDTYDTLAGADLAADVAAESDVPVGGVRLDSGDLAELSREVTALFEERGADLDVFVSSGLDEYAVREFLNSGGVAAGFGVGTRFASLADAPNLDLVYKLSAVERDGDLVPTMKLSTGKTSLPGEKQVFRRTDAGTHVGDVVDVRGADGPGDPLLKPVVEDGDLIAEVPSLDAIRERARRERRRLPADVRAVESPESYSVEVGDDLGALTERTRERIRERRG
jgi:nicotinate phosphoribosyltransferase